MNNINIRIKELRLACGLSQDAFANKLGLKSRGKIANLEFGKTDADKEFMDLICSTFNVNRTWLSDGTGEMFVSSTPYEKAYNRFGYIMENATPSKKAALSLLLELLYSVPDDKWDIIMKEFDEIKKEG